MRVLKSYLGWFVATPFIIAGVVLAFGLIAFGLTGWILILAWGWPWWVWLIWWACAAGLVMLVNYTPEIEDLY